jgi:predicted transcriptional regulator
VISLKYEEEKEESFLEQALEVTSYKALGFRKPWLVKAIIRMRYAGKSYYDIAEELNISEVNVRTYLNKMFERVKVPGVNELRETMGYQIDRIIERFVDDASRGDKMAAAIVLKAIERKAKLYNLEQASIHLNLGIQKPPWEKVYEAVLVEQEIEGEVIDERNESTN